MKTTPSGTPDRPFWFLNELAQYLGISSRTIQRQTADDAFPAPSASIGSRPVWFKKDIEDWLDKGGSSSH
jgi:predicted DNA-binding transcriptional regulator AlpA